MLYNGELPMQVTLLRPRAAWPQQGTAGPHRWWSHTGLQVPTTGTAKVNAARKPLMTISTAAPSTLPGAHHNIVPNHTMGTAMAGLDTHSNKANWPLANYCRAPPA